MRRATGCGRARQRAAAERTRGTSQKRRDVHQVTTGVPGEGEARARAAAVDTRRDGCVLVWRLSRPITLPRTREHDPASGARMPNVVRWVLARWSSSVVVRAAGRALPLAVHPRQAVPRGHARPVLPLRADDRRRVPRDHRALPHQDRHQPPAREPRPAAARPLARQGEGPRERIVPATRREVRPPHARHASAGQPPRRSSRPAVDEYLKMLDDESNYPILLHCKAGLHRTGRLTAIYRMEYQGWSQGEALRELRANGYGLRRGQRGGRVHHPVRAELHAASQRPRRCPPPRRRGRSDAGGGQP